MCVPNWNGEIVFNRSMPDSAVFDALPDWVWILKADGTMLAVNDAALAGTGATRETLVGQPVFSLLFEPKRDHERLLKFGQKALTEGATYLRATMRGPKNAPAEVEMHAAPVDFHGERAVLVVARDVGAQIREERLARTLYEAFRRSSDVMFYSDRNGIILDVNEAFLRIYGYTRAEALGQSPRILRSRHSTKTMYEKMWSSILTAGYWRGHIVNRAKDGREIPLVLTITAVRDPQGDVIGYISNGVDMTEQTALQSRVAHAEALAAIGEMAAVVAHEIRNPLGSIVMAAKQLGSGGLSPEDAVVVKGVIETESRRLSDALTNFLNYARPRELKLEIADFNSVVDEVVRMLQSNSELLGGVAIEVSLDDGLTPMRLDADQLRQVVWNLTLNAIQAMSGGGRMTVSTGRDGAFAFLRVADTGPGIPEASRALLFRPFYTTKQQGTGLGLAVADRIVKAHGGTIAVDTGPQGTAFTILIPSGEL